MPAPPTRNGGPPAQGPAAAHANSATARPQVQPDRTATAQELVAFAILFLAAGDARLDWVLVRQCPLCGFAHRHLRFESGASAIVRAPGCARHRSYRISITDVVPSVAERRIRGAA